MKGTEREREFGALSYWDPNTQRTWHPTRHPTRILTPTHLKHSKDDGQALPLASVAGIGLQIGAVSTVVKAGSPELVMPPLCGLFCRHVSSFLCGLVVEGFEVGGFLVSKRAGRVCQCA